MQSGMLRVLYCELNILMLPSEIYSLPALTISTPKVKSNKGSIFIGGAGDSVVFRLLLFIALTRLAAALASNRCFTLLLLMK